MATKGHVILLVAVVFVLRASSHFHQHGKTYRRHPGKLSREKRQTSCDVTEKYRSYDGTCHNTNNPHWGSVGEIFRRWLPPVYNDNLKTPRKFATSGNLLPNPRRVSVWIHDPQERNATTLNQMTMQWGQFLDHDITNTPTAPNTTACCYDDLLDGGEHPDVSTGGTCFPIIIPEGDLYFNTRELRCMYFERSASEEVEGVRQQHNLATSWIDGSQIYGSSKEKADELRSFKDGKLDVTVRSGNEFLPIDEDATLDEDSCFLRKDMGDFCFKAGDHRVNVYPGLNALHTVFLRYHNIIAGRLANVNPSWEDEELFQEARRIVIAVLQRISYDEFLVHVMGPDNAASLTSGTSTYSYDATADGSLPNVFSTAAFRFGHSMIGDKLNIGGDIVETGKLFNRPGFVLDSMTDVMNAIMEQASQRTDRWYTAGMTNQMFEKPDHHGSGFDIAARNIQRGRDHGLPGLNEWRDFCGLSRYDPTDFLSIDTNPGSHRNFSLTYESTDDIDLYTGGVTEINERGTNLGQTFTCILQKVFSNLRSGDRFWYENTADAATSFTPDQVAGIQRLRLSRVLCDTIDGITSIPRNVFRKVDAVTNAAFECDLLPDIPIESLWAEDVTTTTRTTRERTTRQRSTRDITTRAPRTPRERSTRAPRTRNNNRGRGK